MRRREFITLLGGAATAPMLLSLAARAQQPKRIGVLQAFPETDPDAQSWTAAFRDGLRKLGWIEGRNLQIDHRWATLDATRMQEFARQLVALKPDLIMASSTTTTRILMQETRTIPIVFANIVDPVGSGFIASMAKPGGNVTGFINLEASIAGKYVELLKEIAPNVARILIFYNPATATYADIYLMPFKAAAAVLGVQPVVAAVHDTAELEAAITAQGREPNGALMSMPDPFNTAHSAEIAALAARHRLPAIHVLRQFARQGGLMSYGNDITDNYRRAAGYVDRILRGEKPGELPAQLPVKFELVINLKTAKALGLDVPFLLQQRADEVIE